MKRKLTYCLNECAWNRFKRRDEIILRAIERTTSVYSLAWEIKGDVKEVHGTLGLTELRKQNWSRIERNVALFKLHQFLH